MVVFFLIIVTSLLTKLGFDLIIPLLTEGGLITENYQGKAIPLGYGLLFTINSILILILGTIIGIYDFNLSNKLIILILTMSLIGIIDDALGQKKFQGFKGHLKALFLEYKLTTGFLKMTFSFVIVFYLFFYWEKSFIAALISTLIVLLGANFINLLDVRPGRALKGFILLMFLVIFYLKEKILLLGIPSLVMALFSLSIDLKQKGMMGDIGANILGGVLMLLFTINISFSLQIVALISLIIINIYSEFYSLTELIANNKLLKFIDKLGVN